jgi:hypothetical protein
MNSFLKFTYELGQNLTFLFLDIVVIATNNSFQPKYTGTPQMLGESLMPISLFLDIVVKATNNSFLTKVYQKPTDAGRVLNAVSKCPEHFKRSAISALIQQALKTSPSENDLNMEVKNCKRTLVNNGFANRIIDTEISKP